MTATKIKGHIPSSSRETLRLAYRLDQRINSKLRQLEALEVLTGQVLSLACQPAASDKLENALSKLAELKSEIAADISQLIEQKREIQEMIHTLPNPEQQLLLELKYLGFRTWQDVAETMNYSYRQIHRLHQQVLRKLDKQRRVG